MEHLLRQQIEQIVALTDDEFAYVLSHFTARRYKKHQYIIQEGELAPYDHFVAKGLVKSAYTDEQGKEHMMAFAMEQWWVSDPQAYYSHQKATLNVSCLEDTETFCISAENKDKICADLQKMEYFFRKKAQAGYVALQRRILSLLSKNAQERYSQFLALYPKLSQRISKGLIAAYLGISRETLSRLATT